MKNKILKSLLFITITTIILIGLDFFYSIYNNNYYFELSDKTFLPAFIFSILISLIRKKLWRAIAIIGIVSSSLIEFLYFQYFGDFLQPIAFIQFFNNVHEVSESLIPSLPQMIVPILMCLFAYVSILAISNIFSKDLISFKYSSGIIILALVGNLIMTYAYIYNSSGKLHHWQARALYPNKKELSLFNFNKSVNYLLVGILPKKIMGNLPSFPVNDKPSTYETFDNNIILIIGESLRYDYMSLFGYKEKTTPVLDSLANIDEIDYKTILSGGTMTKTSFAVIMNRLQYPSMEQIISQENNLFFLAKEKDYKTHFISSQTSKSVEIIESLISKNNIDNYANKNDLPKYIEQYSGRDEDLFTMLKRINLKEKNFIILHQRGSHSPYKGFTKKYQKFESNYDNTILYTDALLTHIYKYLKENSNKNTYIIFTSDHGELLGERGKNGHGWFEPEVYYVPLVVASINSSKKINITDINCHLDVSNNICRLMGYEIDPVADSRDIYVNGSDIDGLAGYMIFKTKKDTVISTELVR